MYKRIEEFFSVSLQNSLKPSNMLRVILSTFLFLQVANGWGWFKPCRYLEMVNCDFPVYSADSYYRRDGDWDSHRGRHDNDNYHRHGHDNDDYHRHGHDNDNYHRHGHDNDNYHRHGHDNDDYHRHGHDNDHYHRHGRYDDDNKNQVLHERYHKHGDKNRNERSRGNWFGNRKVCGSDGVTYKNKCYFTKAQCKHKNIFMRHDGACTTGKTDAPKQTTPQPRTTAQPTTPRSQSHDKFCTNLMKQICHGVNPICGTNHQSYDNECEFEKAKCLDGTLHVQHLGVC